MNTINNIPPPGGWSRRALLVGSASAAASLGLGTGARAEDLPIAAPEGEAYTYEVTRTEAEWRAQLEDDAYWVLREGGTEVPHTSLLAFQTNPGTYFCKGCDLTIYDSEFKVPLPEIGWVFFRQSRENSVLMGIDVKSPYGGGMGEPQDNAVIEAHCRRCGSHFGHVLTVKGKTLHCINGVALNYMPDAA